MNEKALLRLKQEIDTAEREAAQLEGQRQYLLQQLKENFGCSSLEAGHRKLEKLEEEIEAKNQELADAIAEIEELYDGE